MPMPLEVLYEDNHLIAVYKPAGLLTQKDKTGDMSLLDEVRDYLIKKYHKPGNAFVGMLHRLDRPVSGIVLFAKTSKGASRLSEQFRNRTIRKTYHCLALGSPRPLNGVLKNYVVKDHSANKTGVVNTGGKEEVAELAYETQLTDGHYALLKILLKTGKSHQIRSQLAYIGCPIIGDVKYGAPLVCDINGIALIASELSFNSTISGKRITITAPYPDNWVKLIKQHAKS